MIGCSERGYKDGSFQQAMFSSPQGVIICDNKIFVADTDNHVIRKVCFVLFVLGFYVVATVFQSYNGSQLI